MVDDDGEICRSFISTSLFSLPIVDFSSVSAVSASSTISGIYGLMREILLCGPGMVWFLFAIVFTGAEEIVTLCIVPILGLASGGGVHGSGAAKD